jgi:imidazolonepropionase-like amidohydrolase
MGSRLLCCYGLVFWGGIAVQAQDLALQVGRVFSMAGEPWENGWVLIQDGRIAAVGSEVAVPEGVATLKFEGGVAMPGLVDAHTFLGNYFEPEEGVEAFTPEMQQIDLFNPNDPLLTKYLAEGVTTVLIAPANGNVSGGQTAVVKLAGSSWEEQVLRETAGLKLCFTAEALRPDRYPTSRFGLWDLVQQQFRSAREAEGEGKGVRREILQRALAGELQVQMQAVRADEILAAARIAEEFGLAALVLHADRAYQVLKPLAQHPLGVVCGPLRWGDETRILENPGRLAAAGLPLAFCSDAPLTDGNSLRRTAALAVHYGLDPATALRALTQTAAQLLGIDHRIGSLEVGKDGDVVVFSGDPLDLTSAVELVVVNGRVVYRRERAAEG